MAKKVCSSVDGEAMETVPVRGFFNAHLDIPCSRPSTTCFILELDPEL